MKCILTFLSAILENTQKDLGAHSSTPWTMEGFSPDASRTQWGTVSSSQTHWHRNWMNNRCKIPEDEFSKLCLRSPKTRATHAMSLQSQDTAQMESSTSMMFAAWGVCLLQGAACIFLLCLQRRLMMNPFRIITRVMEMRSKLTDM